MNRALTHAEVLGITGTEPPLTTDDIRAAVRYTLSGWRGDFLLRGDRDVRRGDWGSGGHLPDGRSVMCFADRRGLLVHITEPGRGGHVISAGHIPWRAAEAVLRQLREPETAQGSLFDLAVSA